MCLWNLAEILQFDPKPIIKYLSKTIMLSVSKLVFQSRYKAWETLKYNGLYNLYSVPKTMRKSAKKSDKKSAIFSFQG